MKARNLSAFAGLVLSCVGTIVAAESTARPEEAFKQSARVVLHGNAASELVTYCGLPSGGTVSDIALSSIDIDKIESELEPLLADDLRSENSGYRVSEYRRQYATATWQNRQMVYVLGFRSSTDGDHEYWISKPVIVSDGGSGYWCAIYDQKMKKFIKQKEEGRPIRTVRFNGYA